MFLTTFYDILYVDGQLCRVDYSKASPVYIDNCFNESKYYNVTFQGGNYNGNNNGMAFQLIETYKCPYECPDCLNDECCQKNYKIHNSSCN